MNETTEVTLIQEREVDGVVAGTDGTIVHNSFQMDDPIIMRRYSDGMVHLLSKQTGKLIVARYDPKTYERHHCPHCNGVLGA